MSTQRKTGIIASLVGIVYGLAYLAGGYLNNPESGTLPAPVVEGLFLTLFMPFAMHLYWRISHEKIVIPLVKIGIGARFQIYEPYTYLVFLLAAGFLLGINPNSAFTIALWLLLIATQAFTFIFLLDKEERLKLVCNGEYVAVLFLVSGFSALIYQVVWQRTLFTTFGINSESVTVIVSVFMFGLGIGSLAGGYFQKKFPRHLLSMFLMLEISIGLFGLFSLDLIHAVGRLSGTTSTESLILWIYCILALPTLLMGATLPILVALLQGYFRNIGKTVGLLYAFNTIGSAIAAFCTVEMLFVFFGQQTSILIAVGCNFITAFLIYGAGSKLAQANTKASPHSPQYEDTDKAPSPHLSYAFIFIVLSMIGYISLSHEILWFRLLGYMTANRPQIFGLLLTAFLVGIALGSLRSKKICESERDVYTYLVRALACAIAIFYLSTPLVAETTALLNKETATVLAYIAIAAVAFLTGGILPMLIHTGIKDKQSCSTHSVAWLYFANIVGATLGPLFTGFILLDWFTLEANIVILTGVTLLLLLSIILVIPKSTAYKAVTLMTMGTMILCAWLVHPYLYRGYLEKIQYATTAAKPFKYQLENHSGIITTEASDTDIMFGNGIYDGRFNTDPVDNSNLIDRAYLIAALHRHPRNVLEIGLSTGSWTRVIANYDPLEKITVVEINKGYPEIIRHYPDIATVLDHPKVNLVFDDGRRWLRNHPNEKFDLIVMNTSYHWRSNSTNILSKEFLELCKQHLNSGGIAYYNTTGSKDVVYTAASVFNHVVMYLNFVAASDAPFNMTTEEKTMNLLNFLDNGKTPLFYRDERYRKKLDQLVNQELKDIRQEILDKHNLQLITDDNMAVEYKDRDI